jgi:hypothetical protein
MAFVAGIASSARESKSDTLESSAWAGLVLLGLLPAAWLFSASSRFLGLVTLVHVVCWTLALSLAGRQRWTVDLPSPRSS